MRHFYIFKINPSVSKVFKNRPYEVFHTLETLYYQTDDSINLGKNFVKQFIYPISLKELDIMLFKKFKNNYFYMKYKNIHSLHDFYRKESTTLSLHKTFIKLDTNVIKPCFLKELQEFNNLFVCDFESKDYFWLDSFTLGAIFI